MKVFSFIGCGNMGSALAKAVITAAGSENVALCDKDSKKAEALANAYGAEAVSFESAVKNSLFIFLGVKPNAINGVLDKIGSLFYGEAKPVLISMAAGVSIADIRKTVGNKFPIIRIMPNLPVSVGKGVILYCTDGLNEKEKEIFLKAMSFAGLCDEIEESKIDAASAVSGCGPAFVCQFIEAMSDGGVACGLPRDKATLYATWTLLGTAEHLLNTETHPASLKDAVCSPGGTTIEGVRVLEDKGLRSAVIEAVNASYKKSKKMI